MACAVPRWSRANAGHPRSPGAPSAWRVVGGFEGPAAVPRTRHPDRGRRALGRPQHRHVRHRARARRHDGDPRRQLAAEARFAGHPVHLHGRPEPSAAIAAGRDKHVGPAVARRAPGDGDEGAVGRHPGRGIRPPRKAQRHHLGWRRALVAGKHRRAQHGQCDGGHRPSIPNRSRHDAPHPQNLTRAPTCSERGSPTAVIWLNEGDGLPGYRPAPKLVFRVSTLR